MLLTILSTLSLQRRNLSQKGCQLNLNRGFQTSGLQIEPTTDKNSQEDSQLNLSQKESQLNHSQGLPTSGLPTLPTTGSPSSTTRTSRWSMAGEPSSSSRRESLSRKLHLPEPLLLLLPQGQL